MSDIGRGLEPPMAVSVVTVSDRCARGEAVDESGPALEHVAREGLFARIVGTRCVPDASEAIQKQLTGWAATADSADLIVTTGGTGLGPRDVTPEATTAVLERFHSGLISLMQVRCYKITPRVFLSRGVAGTIERSLVINLPGSRKGAIEGLKALIDVLPHAVEMLRGHGHGSDAP